MQVKRQFKPRTLKKTQQRGGAIYTFDLNDKIGGLSARIPLNGTRDGDCPATDTMDLGFVNYGMTRPVASGGGRRRRHRHSKSKTSKRTHKTHRNSTKSRNTKRKSKSNRSSRK
jgi:hypothetical protein